MAQMIIGVVLLIKRCSRYCVNGEPSKKYERIILNDINCISIAMIP